MHKSSILAVLIRWSWSNFEPLVVHALCHLVGVSLSLRKNSGKDISNESSCSCSCSSIRQPLIPQIEPQSQAYHLPDKFQCRRVNFDDPYLSIQGSFCNESKATWKTFELLSNELIRSKFGCHLIKDGWRQRQVVQAATQFSAGQKSSNLCGSSTWSRKWGTKSQLNLAFSDGPSKLVFCFTLFLCLAQIIAVRVGWI